MIQIFITLCLFFLLGWPSLSQAFIYYVSGGGFNGNTCQAARTPSTARQTINSGLSCLSAGDTLELAPGTYDTFILGYGNGLGYTVVPNGTSWSSPTTIRATTSGTVIITSSTTFPGGGAVIQFSNNHYIVLDGLIVDGDHRNNGIDIDGDHLRVTNTEIRYPLNQGVRGDCISCELLSLTIHHAGVTKAGVNDCHGGDPSPADGFCHGIYLFDLGTGNVIDGGTFYSNNGQGVQSYANNTTLKNATIRDNSGVGIYMLGNGIIVRNNIFRNSAGVAIYSIGTGGIIENNTIYNPTPTGSHYGIYARLTDTVIRNNLLMGASSSSGQYIFMETGGGTFATNLCTVAGTHCSIVQASISSLVANASGGDYQLVTGSDAIDAGTTIVAMTTDRRGTPRPQGTAYDIGAEEFSAGGSPPVNQAVLHWTFDEGSGSSSADTTGQGRNALLIGSPTWQPGRIGPTSIQLNGTSQWMTTPNSPNDPAYSWLIWIKGSSVPSTTAMQQVLINGIGAEPWGFNWGHIQVAFRQAAQHRAVDGTYYAAKIPGTLLAGRWYHVAATYDGTTLKVYLNGVLKASTVAPVAVDAGAGGLQLGAGNGTPFAGVVDDPWVFNYALNASQILYAYRTTAGSSRRYMVIR